MEPSVTIGHAIKSVYLGTIEPLVHYYSILLLAQHVGTSSDAGTVELIVTVVVEALASLLAK